jgi:hypothetical protein
MTKGLTGIPSLSYLGVNAGSPPNIRMYNRAPTVNDWQNFIVGDIWLNITPTPAITREVWLLVALLQNQATWQKLYGGAGGNAITNLIDDNGNIVTPLLGGITVRGGANINTNGSVPHIITVNLDTSILQPMTNATGTTGIYALGSTDYITDRFMNAWGTASTYLGYQAGPDPSAGVGSTGNTGIGFNALKIITNAGRDNVAIGHGSMGNSINSTGCVCVGANAGSAITTSQDCIFIGVNAGNIITTGNYDIFINAGHTTEVFPLPANTSNTLAIGSATGSNLYELNTVYICGIQNTAATPQANAFVTMIDTDDLLYGIPNRTAGYVLTSNGPTLAPTWQVSATPTVPGIITLDGDSGTATGATVVIAGGNNITTSAAGATLTVNVSGTTNHALQCGNVGGSLTSLAVGTTGKYLRGATTANPTWSTLTLPDTVALGDVLVASATNVVGVVNNVVNAGYVLTTNVGAAPTFQAIPAAGVTSLNSLTGALSIVAGNNTTVTPLGTNITVGLSGTTQYCLQVGSSVGGITDLILGTSGAVLRSSGVGANPAWSIASYPGTTTANSILVSATSNTVTATTAPSISGTYTTTAGNFELPTTSSTAGQITVNGTPWIHSYGTANTWIGQSGNLTLNTANASGNIGIGYGCLASIVGSGASLAQHNIALGYNTLALLTDGIDNTTHGVNSGAQILTGSFNVLFGTSTGVNYTSSESSNILIGYRVAGTVSESNTLRIGNATGTSNGYLSSAYIAGITGTTSTSGAAVYCNSSNKLGTSTSSIRYKEDVTEMPDTSSIISKLRPVTFKFKEDTFPKPLQYGLIAEEVEPIWPEMVIYGPDGLPQNLAYQFLAPILLKEIQSLRKRIEQLESKT